MTRSKWTDAASREALAYYGRARLPSLSRKRKKARA